MAVAYPPYPHTEKTQSKESNFDYETVHRDCISKEEVEERLSKYFEGLVVVSHPQLTKDNLLKVLLKK